MKDIVIVMDGPCVMDVYSDDARGYVVIQCDTPDVCHHYSGKTHEQLPWWAAHRLRLEGCGFQVGGRVRFIKRDDRDVGGPVLGALGVIRSGLSTYSRYGVEFDGVVMAGHILGGEAKKGHGWFCDAKQLEQVDSWRALKAEFDEFKARMQALEKLVAGLA